MTNKLISVYKASHPIFPTAVMANAYAVSMKDSIGVDDFYPSLLTIVKDKKADWHISQEDIDRVTPKVLDALMEKPELS